MLEHRERRGEAVHEGLVADGADFTRAECTGERQRAEQKAAERGARLLEKARRSQAAIAAGWAKAMEQMGITAEPVGHAKLRQMMLECGVDPNDNAFSREIIAMREE